MAYYIRGNRILTQREKDTEDIGGGCAGMILLLLLVLFVLSPGIIITSILSLMMTFTTGQLWGTAIIGSIVVAIGLAIAFGGSNLGKTYLGTAVLSTIFMIVMHLMTPNNCFSDTVIAMMDWGESTESTESTEQTSHEKETRTEQSNASNNYYSSEPQNGSESITDTDVTEEIIDESDEEMQEEMSVSQSNEFNETLYERQLQESDIEGLSSNELELMRNMIYARHGYIFQRMDLLDYFKQYSWYYPKYSVVNDVYEMMSDIERYNVDFIKKHE